MIAGRIEKKNIAWIGTHSFALRRCARESCPAVPQKISWDSESGAVEEAGRWRAIIIEKMEKVGESLLGQGHGTYFMRAVLPHGSWRVENAEFAVAREALIPVEKTLLGK